MTEHFNALELCYLRYVRGLISLHALRQAFSTLLGEMSDASLDFIEDTLCLIAHKSLSRERGMWFISLLVEWDSLKCATIIGYLMGLRDSGIDILDLKYDLEVIRAEKVEG